MKLERRNAIITGASQGLGLEIARHFVREGANVMICARDRKKLAEAESELKALQVKDDQQVVCRATDVSEASQVEALVDDTLQHFKRIDILVANAGVYGTKGAIEEVDIDEWSRAIDINLKGVFYQSRAVLPHFKANQYGKIIILSGGGATKPLPNLSAYAASKAGVVRFAETLACEVADDHIDVNTVAPGALNTGMLDEILAAGPERVGETFYTQSLKQKESGGTSLDKGASLAVFLASQESDGITGRLISAVWDPWKSFPQFVAKMDQSDIYTLRRIIPEDRGEQWGDAS